MTVTNLQPGEVTEIFSPLISATDESISYLKSDHLEVLRVNVPADRQLTTYHAPGDMTVQGLTGRIYFGCLGKTHELTAGQMLFLPAGTAHTVQGNEDGALLLTIVTPEPPDPIDEASEETFPASDAPAWTGNRS